MSVRYPGFGLCRDIMCLREIICRQYIDQLENKIPPPKHLEDIGYSEILGILKAEFPKAKIHLADRDYKTTTKAELMRFLKYDLTDLRKYLSEYYDCDDFSYALMGAISNPDWGALPFAILWTTTPKGGHAINCFIDNDREVWIIEPQNDRVFECPNGWEPYLLMM